MEGQTKDKKKIVIVGAGPVGNLNACYFARDGHEVEVYEKYRDPRIKRPNCSRSINLTLGHRGKVSLEQIGLLNSALHDAIPAYGRNAWQGDGKLLGQVEYGEKGESIESVSRFEFNLFLLNEADKYKNVTVFFSHDLSVCDFDAGTVKFFHEENGEKKEKIVTADLFIGADGAHSAMRAEMSKQKKLDFLNFEYHEHGYLELLVPSINGEYPLERNRLHVWPKDTFTLICLPNRDRSFTGTLVMPFPLFNQMLQDEKSLVDFFRKEFSQVLELVGEESLIQQFKPGQPGARTPCKLASVKCQPYHAASDSGAKFVLHGDAAHAMVPFYGQGMNTGFEDVQIFQQIVQKHGTSKEGFNAALEEFSANRCKDGHAMSDFSYHHYQALCSKVKKKNYNIRRHLDSWLHAVFPTRWYPEYTLVAFSSKPHSECREILNSQDAIMHLLFYFMVFMLIAGFTLGIILIFH